MSVEDRPFRPRVEMVIPISFAGHHHYTAELCRHLLDAGIAGEIELLSIFSHQSVEMDLLPFGMRSFVISPKYPSRAYRLLVTMRNQIAYILRLVTCRPHVVHIQSPSGWTWYDLCMIAIYRLLRIPTIRTVHEVTLERMRPVGKFERWAEFCKLRMMDKLIVHNTAMKRSLVSGRIKSPKDIAVIPHGNYLMFRRYMPYDEIPPRDGALPTLLFFGFRRHKGLEYFVEAVRQLYHEGHRFRSVVAGYVNPVDDVDMVALCETVPEIELVPGYIPNEMMWKHFVDCDVVVMPYIKGTTSGAIHLSYAFEKPSIVSDLDCFEEAVIPGETALVVPRRTVGPLKRAILALIEDPERGKAMGKRGYELERSARWDWTEIARATGNVYREIIYRKRS